MLLRQLRYFSIPCVLLGASCGGLFGVSSAHAADLQVAVAANFQAPLEAIAKSYTAATSHKVLIVSGASGKFFAQIENGAPFDVFLSADQTFPKKLVEKKLADPASRFTYAEGALVLWSPDPKRIDAEGKVLRDNQFKHLAIANSELAPYGKAAEETLQKLGLFETLKPKFVTGESVGQTFQFISSGNAELGFVPLSMTKDPVSKLQKHGSQWIVPKEDYAPILQDAVLLTSSKNKKQAQAFLDYLKTKEVKTTIGTFGYTFSK
jgi:molybdate transport system substrate-binding protein